ncbi:MAG: hypothetical protein U1E22_03095, partial [Coriobacteriia bacterium]|nr:hypothetical protein [Coriobacteriia bacterium]
MSLHAIYGREDPTPWLLASDEPQALWIARPTPETHAEVLAHPATARLLEMLPTSWEEPATASGHNK